MTTVISVEGGVVQEVINNNDYIVIDFNDLESGHCPYCRAQIEDDICGSCNIDWSQGTYQETAEKVLKLRQKQ
jgi:threonine dehydrogenase-like Zn-dependent dehydrogenase